MSVAEKTSHPMYVPMISEMCGIGNVMSSTKEFNQ